MRGLADHLQRSLGAVPVLALAHVADNVLDHHHRAIHDHSEIQRAERQQVRGNALQIEARRGKQQRERHRQRDDDCPADIPEKQKENDHDQNDALREVVQHRMRRVVHQVAAVDERDHLYAGRQDVVIQLFDLGVDSREGLVCIRAFAQEDDA